MANLNVKDGASADKYLKTDGAGTNVDPHVPHHVVDSGVVTANIGTPGELATEATLGDVIKEGTDITGATMPAGGASARGWLSAIWKALTDRLPAALGQTTSASSLPVVLPSDQTVPIGASSLPLPSGAATSANQSTEIARLETLIMQTDGVEGSLASIDSKIPASPATAAKQDTGNTSLSSIDTKLGEVQASPTANTVLDRLKALLTGIVLAAGNNNIGDVDIASIAAGDNNIGNIDVVTVPSDPFGANADAAVAAGAAGSIAAKLRRATQGLEDLKTAIVLAAGAARIGKITIRNSADAADIDPLAESTFTARIGEVQASPTTNTVLSRLKDLLTGIVLAAGTNIIGKVGIDQTTDGTTNAVNVVTSGGAGATVGTTSGAAVVTDANGTLQQYLRGLVKLWIAGLAASEAHIGEVGGNLTMIATEFTRPSDTTAYAANDMVSDSTSTTTMQALANAARVAGGSGYITGIRVLTDKKSITPRLRVHIFNTNGATLAADNANYKDLYADSSKRVGWWDMPAMTTAADASNSDNSRTLDLTVRIPYTCAATSLYYVLETLDAFTPASAEKFTVTFFCDRN